MMTVERRRRLAWLSMILKTVILCSMISWDSSAQGTVRVVPDHSTVRDLVTWTVTYVPGSPGMRAGGSIKIRFPKGFGARFPSEALQTEDSLSPGYISAHVTSAFFRLETMFTKKDSSIWWDWERIDGNVTARLVPLDSVMEGNYLTSQDSIVVTFGANPPQGGLVSPEVATIDSILIAVDNDGSGAYEDIQPRPLIRTIPLEPYKLRCIVPSRVQKNEVFTVRIVILDRYANPAWNYEGTILLRDNQGSIIRQIPVAPEDSGIVTTTHAIDDPGIHRLGVADPSRTPVARWEIRSNPIEIVLDSQYTKIYWGDLHSHSAISMDGHGRTAFRYARDVSGLDFYALTDHSEDDYSRDGITTEEWNDTKAQVFRYNDPGKFVTILAYEASFGPPSGHNNVYYFGTKSALRSVPVFHRHRYPRVLDLWSVFRSRLEPAVKTFTIPHHTGILWNKRIGSEVDFHPPFLDPLYRPVVEIYSGHGSSEKYPPRSTMSYQYFRPERGSSDGLHYAQDAIGLGHHIGHIASTDDHSSRPGLAARGLTAIQAISLSRSSLYDAVLGRSVYATTGERILLEFSEMEIPMGQRGTLGERSYPHFTIRLSGTSEFESVELLKFVFNTWDSMSGEHPEFRNILGYVPSGIDIDLYVIDSSYASSSVYYLRAKQRANTEDMPDRIARESWVWSSPIWVMRDLTHVPEFTSSNASSIDDNVVYLTWRIENAETMDRLTVLRAANGGSLSEVGVIPFVRERDRSYAYVDSSVTPGRYSYVAEAVLTDGTIVRSREHTVYVGTDPMEGLYQNYPNPFNTNTIISYGISNPGRVSLDVYDLTGRRVRSLVDMEQDRGYYSIGMDASRLSSGVYYCRLRVDNKMYALRLQLLK